MRTRRQSSSLTANPVLIGAVTTLVVVVAVFLSYNANSGLPFVPTYGITVHLPDAERLVPGNEVRMGGRRVGVLKELEPRVGRDGTPSALATLALEESVAPLARDTRVTVRARSPLGLKYIELVPGTSRATVPEDSTMDRREQARPVELDDVLDTFDAPTRRATQEVLEQLGGGLAGRGGDLNLAIGSLRPAVRRLAPVMRSLAAPGTDLDGLVDGLASAARATAPVGGSLRRTVAHLGRTLDAVAGEGRALDAALAELPETERAGARAFAGATPVLARTASLLRDLRPATPLLRRATGDLADVTGRAPAHLRATRAVAAPLGRTLAELGALARRPATSGAVRRLTPVVTELRSMLPDVLPMQTACNYLGLWLRNVNSATSEGDRNGRWFRFGVVSPVDEMLQQPRPVPNLHTNPYPRMAPGDCEAGNEPYLPGRRIGNIPGDQGPTELTARPAGLHR